jgi:hypothetical protein
MQRDWIIGLIVTAALGLIGWWIVSNTEWREETVQLPLQGPAREDPMYASAKLVEQLGANVVRRTDLSLLPPPNAVLLLGSDHWNLFSGQEAALRSWVENGGRLVLSQSLVQRDEMFGAWIRITARDHREEDTAEDEEASDEEAPDEESSDKEAPDEAMGSNEPDAPRSESDPDECSTFVERTEPTAPAATTPRRMLPVSKYTVCGLSDWDTLELKAQPAGAVQRIWSLDSKRGPAVLRLATGRGSVTVLSDDAPLRWRTPLERDNAKFLVAITQLARGDDVWFVTQEDAEALLQLVWKLGWPVVVLLTLALVLTLWRDMARFGPLAANPSPARRSLGEQIRGTAEFLVRYRRAAALLAAQKRALDEAAARSIRGWQSMSESARDAALAQLARVDPAALARARTLPARAHAHDYAQAIALLEHVRRRATIKQRRENHVQ